MTLTQITEKGIKDGEILNADINANAAIAKSKLASLEIVNADINASAAIAKSKLASLDIVNADINASASIAGTKIDPSFTSDITVTNTQPKISFVDTNADDDFEIKVNAGNFAINDATNSINRFLIDSSGNIGIGTASPDVNLHLTGDKPKLRLESTNTLETSAGTEEIARIEFEGTKGSNINVAASMRVRQDGTWSTSDDFFSPTAIEFYTQDQSGSEITSPRVTINSTGNVGINRTPTQHPLELQHASEPTLSLWRGSTKGAALQAQSGGTYLYSYQNAPILFSVNSSSGFTERMRIDTSGRLLLGRTSGSFPLDVAGAARISDIFYMDNDKRIQWGGSNVAYIEGNDNEKLVFGVGSERARIDNNGHLAITDGNLEVASGHGIDFSNVSDGSRSVSSNLLDDYEEGSFTPILQGTTTTGAFTYHTQTGLYRKIGKVVHFQVDVRLNGITTAGSGYVIIVGMPYAAVSSPYGAASVSYYTGWTGNAIHAALINVNNAQLYLYKNLTTGNITNAQMSDVTASSRVVISGMYATS